MDEAAKSAAVVLLDLVQPRARAVIDEHRSEGRLLVLATTTPYDLVKPLADLLGFDDVVATRYGVADDGTYNGTIVGNFVWANGKLAAVRKWADEHGVDLASSYFYSDSVYDTPLLSAVGHPFAVNPDPGLRLVASARRWPTLHLDVPDGVPKFLGFEPQQVAMAFTRPELVLYARFDIAGVERIPNRGPAIIVANHRSYFDITAMAMLFSKAGRPVRFLGKKEVFDVPVVGQVAKAFGGIRVDRGTGSDEPLKAAVAALDAGDLVAIMPQGTIPRGPAFFDPVLKGRWGAARLAHTTRVPVIPVGLWGTEKVWPRERAAAERVERDEPAHDPRARRSCCRAQVQEHRQGHRADHGGDHGVAARRSARAARADSRGAAPHLSVGLQGRSDERDHEASRHGLVGRRSAPPGCAQHRLSSVSEQEPAEAKRTTATRKVRQMTGRWYATDGGCSSNRCRSVSCSSSVAGQRGCSAHVELPGEYL